MFLWSRVGKGIDGIPEGQQVWKEEEGPAVKPGKDGSQ